LRNKVLLGAQLLAMPVGALLEKALRGSDGVRGVVSTVLRCSIATSNDVKKQREKNEKSALLPRPQ